MYILLLEDNVIDADLTRRGLESSIQGCIIKVCSTLKQAKDMLGKGMNFDIALLDMQLPDGTGIEMLMEIRVSGLELPVIMITGSGNEEVATAVLKAGADDYIIKRKGYVENLPAIIEYAIKNHFQRNQELKEIIKVLYIEQHSTDIDLTFRHMNQYAPYIHLDFVLTAEKALEIIQTNDSKTCKYKVILLDYHLSGINALEFIKIIRQEKKLTLPIILVTGHGNEDVAIQALKLGANDYLVKRDNYLYRLPSAILNVYQHFELIKKQVELAQSESKYRLLADNSADVIFVLDKDLKYTYVSPAIKTLIGFEPDEVLNLKIEETLTTESLNKALKALSELLSNTQNQLNQAPLQKTVELELLCKDNSTVWTEIRASVCIDENHKTTGIIGVTREIASRRLAEENIRKLSRAVEQSPVSVIITDLKGTIEYVNPKFSKVSGYSFDEVKGQNPRILKSEKTTSEDYKNLWRTILAGDEWFGELLNKKKNGSLYWESASISPIRNEEGKITHFLAVKEDITEKKKEHEELVAAKEHAEESDRLKSAFLANMSHEIRTPMNGILGFADLLKKPELTGDQQQEYIEIIEKSGVRMLNIINDIVDISKIESGQMKVSNSETNVNRQIEFIYNLFKPEAEFKEVQLIYNNGLSNTEALITTDREKLYAILTNLVKNAIKFTNFGTIELGYFLTTQCSDKVNPVQHLEFYVKDTGIGIPKNRQEAIFERFIQADISDKMAIQGAGLGLSISKAYVEMLGGKIWVESEVDKGSTFHFTIPYIQLTMEENPTTIEHLLTINKTKVRQLKLLIVEDELESIEFIKIAMKSYCKDILTSISGDDAVEICRNNPDIDLVLMDIKVPVIDGYEATRQIREFNSNVIIIAQTAYALAGDRDKALLAGCNDYISKPIKPEKLMELLEKYF